MNAIELGWTSSLAITERQELLQTASEWLQAEPSSKTKTPAELASLQYGMFALQATPAKNTLVGFGALSPLGGCAWELSSVVVAPQHRAKGIGTFIVTQLKDFFFEYEEPRFGDVCLVCQPALEAFYESLGFVSIPADCVSLTSQLTQKAEQALTDSKVFMMAFAI